MKRWMKSTLIAVYLGLLGYGLIAHVFDIDKHSSVGKYFIVWDMFCGWDCFETKRLIIGEGESGAYYDLSPTWNDFQPFRTYGRQDYDHWGNFGGIIALNTLRHTEHEPMARLLLIEQNWAKKYNLPDHLWNQRHGEPRSVQPYYNLKTVYDLSGAPVEHHYGFAASLSFRAVVDNPRLKADVAKSRPYLNADQFFGTNRSGIQQASHEQSLPR